MLISFLASLAFWIYCEWSNFGLGLVASWKAILKFRIKGSWARREWRKNLKLWQKKNASQLCSSPRVFCSSPPNGLWYESRSGNCWQITRKFICAKNKVLNTSKQKCYRDHHWKRLMKPKVSHNIIPVDLLSRQLKNIKVNFCKLLIRGAEAVRYFSSKGLKDFY